MDKEIMLSLFGVVIAAIGVVLMLIDGNFGGWMFIASLILLVIFAVTSWSQYTRAKNPRPVELGVEQRRHVRELKATDTAAAVKQVRRYNRRVTLQEAIDYVDGL